MPNLVFLSSFFLLIFIGWFVTEQVVCNARQGRPFEPIRALRVSTSSDCPNHPSIFTPPLPLQRSSLTFCMQAYIRLEICDVYVNSSIEMVKKNALNYIRTCQWLCSNRSSGVELEWTDMAFTFVKKKLNFFFPIGVPSATMDEFM
jgi:hypothetical protein